MTKGILFIGDALTNKSRTAKQIQKFYGDYATYLDGSLYKPESYFYFSQCKPNTKVLIIDGIANIEYLIPLMLLISAPLTVYKQCQDSFKIQLETLIVICSSEIKESDLPSGASFERRFRIVEFPIPEISELFSDNDLMLIDDTEKPFDFDKLFGILQNQE